MLDTSSTAARKLASRARAKVAQPAPEDTVAIGTPAEISGRQAVADFFNGAARSALPVLVERRPGAAWFDRGVARVVFDFTVTDGRVSRIDFRAAPEVLEQVRRRRGGEPRTRPEG